MTPDQITYALAKQVPDMQQRAFTIETAYGAIEIPCGPMAERIAKLVHSLLEAELKKQSHDEEGY